MPNHRPRNEQFPADDVLRDLKRACDGSQQTLKKAQSWASLLAGQGRYTRHLSAPSFDSMRLPDLSVMRRDSAVVGTISELAFKNIENIDITQWPTMGHLERQLIDQLSAMVADATRLAFYVAIGVRLGYITGILENKAAPVPCLT